MSANASYERSAQNISVVTGMAVSRGSQQRLVHRQTFELADVEGAVEEMSIDGGKVRIRTPKGEICRWQDYKAVNLHGHCREAFLQENERLVEWGHLDVLSTSTSRSPQPLFIPTDMLRGWSRRHLESV